MSAQVDNSRTKSPKFYRVKVKLFFGITEKWQLTDDQACVLAGQSSRMTLHRWKVKLAAGDDLKISPDAVERISYIAWIYKALQLLFTDSQQWREWERKPNRAFGGQSALDRMLAGRITDLADMRRYLDAQRAALPGGR